MTEQQDKINQLIARLEAHQAALGLNDTQFVARYGRYVGSQKTWTTRLKGRQWKEIEGRGAKWLANLTSLVTVIDGGNVIDEFYDSLPIAEYGFRRYEILQGQTNDRRCCVLLGVTGVGKSITLRRINQKNATASVYVCGSTTWSLNLMQISLALAQALGCTIGGTPAGTFRNVIEHLKANPVTVLIDEAHEGGVLLFKLVKTLINETRAKFILSSYPTAWARICNGNNDSYAEAQQLMGRTLRPIEMRWTKGVWPEDVTAYLEAASGLNGKCKVLADRVTTAVRRGGNFRLLADAMEMARICADSDGREMTPELIEECIGELCPTSSCGKEGGK
jgi:hypothetical protein